MDEDVDGVQLILLSFLASIGFSLTVFVFSRVLSGGD